MRLNFKKNSKTDTKKFIFWQMELNFKTIFARGPIKDFIHITGF